MAEPKRLLEELGSGLERDLLIVGSSERAPVATRRRLEGALLGAAPLACAVVAPPEAAVAAGGGLSAPSTSALFASAAKWLAIGVLAGGTLSGAAAGVAASLPGSRPELYSLPSVSRQVSSATRRMRTEREPGNSEAAVLAAEATTRRTTVRRPSGTVLIGPPALRIGRLRPGPQPTTGQPSDPNGAKRASTSER